MGKGRKKREAPRIQHIELSEKNIKLRWILAGVLLVIGLVGITMGVNSCVAAESGWQEVQITADRTNCSSDFIFKYHYGQAGLEPTLERRQVTACYSTAVMEAYELFNTQVEGSTLGNLTQLNAGINQPVAVEPELYTALQQIVEAEDRHVYLAAVYEEYARIFRAEDPVIAAEFDPGQNASLLPYLQEAASFACDPRHISLMLLEDGRAQLKVSDAYLAFAEEYGITTFLDLGWMKNAFIVDFMAERLIAEGHTNGYLASFDGFTRNLDTRDMSYSFNIFDRLENDIYLPAVWEYEGPMSIVFLRNFPMSARDSGGYYMFESGRIVTSLIDPADAMSKSATDNLVGYSSRLGCAALVLELAPVFVAEELDEAALNGMTADGIYSIWFDGGKLFYNEQQAKITVQTVDGAAYKANYAK